MEYSSSLWWVPADELRLLWFFINIPGVFLLLGPRAGWAIVAVSVLVLSVSNLYMESPYSPNAMATAVLGMVYLGLFFHVFGARSISYFVRMRDSNQQLQALASRDMLTGVLNARAYYEACGQRVALARRNHRPWAVLFVDLDHFKRVNDTHGHAAGDAVLGTVAQCLQQSIWRSDVLGRIGGEEFSIFLPDTTQEGAVQLTESIRQAVEQCRPDIGTQRLSVTASIGVAAAEGDTQDMAAIQARADEAMYVAKSQGRNRVSVLAMAPPT